MSDVPYVNKNIDKSKFKQCSEPTYPFASKTVATVPEIKARVAELATTIAADYKDKCSKANPLFLICVLKGSYIFTADLARELFRRGIYTHVEFIYVTSYHGTESSGEVRLLLDTREPVEGRHIIFMEDILDTARTLNYLVQIFKTRKAASSKVCVLLDKPEGRVMDFEADYVGFTIAKEFVVGYGLDFDSLHRDIPEVVVLHPKEYMTPKLAESNL